MILFSKEKPNGIRQKGFKIMKRYKRLALLSISFMFIIAVLSILKVNALSVEAADFAADTFNYKWKADTLVSGSKQIEKSFYIPQNMSCNNLVVSLKIKPSQTLIKEISSISILVNNTKVYSVTLNKINVSGILTVRIPDYLIYKGKNSIVIKGFLKSTREKCEINNDINWVILDKTSSFSFSYTRNDSTDISNIFDDTYYSSGSDGEVDIALPNNLVEGNYSHISSLSAMIGFMHKNKETDVKIKTLKYSDLHNIKRETIVIGTVEQIKAFNNELLTQKQWEDAERSGYIAIRKIGTKNHFILITSNDTQMETLCRILQIKSSLSQLKGKDYVLNNNKIVSEKKFNTSPTLNSLGYPNTSQIGNGTKEFNYYFTIPANKTLTEKNKVTFVFNYSSLIDYKNAYVTVAISGENLLSKSLAKDRIQDKLEFTIPEKYFNYVGFNISLRFNLRPDVENCTAQSHDNIWIEIDSLKSNFKLELRERTNYSLLNSQGLLQDSNGNVEGSITVDALKNLSLESICQIASYVGKVSQGVNKLDISESKDNVKSGRAIFCLTSSSVIKKVNSNLRIPISDNNQLVNKDLFIQNTTSLGAIELSLNGGELVITANDKNQLNKTIQNYSKVIGFYDTVILEDGKIIDTFGDTKAISRVEVTLKTNYDIILALALLMGASITIFILYLKKVK